MAIRLGEKAPPMHKRGPTIKAALLQVHSIIGLAFALLLSLIALTGAIMSFEDEIVDHLNAGLKQVAPRAVPALLPDEHVLVYPPVPHAVARVADVERMQMLVEAGQRARLQAFLRAWVPALIALKREHKAVLRWAVDVDPLAI